MEGGATVCSVLPEGSHDAGLGCPGNQRHNIPLPAEARGTRPGRGKEGAAGAASAPSRKGFNSQSELGCSREDMAKSLPPCAHVWPSLFQAGWEGTLWYGCMLSCLLKRIITEHPLFVRSRHSHSLSSKG